MNDKKEMFKEMVLKTTINLYAHYGIRGVSMEQVAGALRISKKTLYEEFGNKEELVCACLDYETERLTKMLEKIDKETTNPIETVVMMTHKLFRYKFFFCSSFHKDIIRFRMASAKLEKNLTLLSERYSVYLEKGCHEGYLQADLDCTTVSSILIDILRTSESSDKSFLLLTLLRGLCTEKGREAIEEITPRNTKEEIYNYN